MKVASKIITIFITLVTIIIFMLYGHLFSQEGFPGPWRVVAFLVITALIAAMAYTGYKRIHEIEKEDKDDLSKY